MKKEILDKISSLDVEKREEQYQYGTSLSIKENIYTEMFLLVQEVLSKTKEIIEE